MIAGQTDGMIYKQYMLTENVRYFENRQLFDPAYEYLLCA